jgi:UrcA family protein
MKRFIALTAFAAAVAAPALAQSVTVEVPKDLTNKQEVAAYKAKLDSAVAKVCRRAASPIVGLNYYVYQDCIQSKWDEVAALDPTGVVAQGKTSKTFDLATK